MRSVEASAVDPASRYFHGDEGRFRDMFNRTAFSFSHSLSRSQLLELTRLFEFKSLPWKELARVGDATISIASPGRISTFHIDRECNFPLQGQGEEGIYI